ncbi:serine/threonine protein kinase [Verrucomicrobiota bacterium]
MNLHCPKCTACFISQDAEPGEHVLCPQCRARFAVEEGIDNGPPTQPPTTTTATPVDVTLSDEDPMIGREIGGCRIESLLGKGGMGSVYRAHHLTLDIPVAIKLMHSEAVGSQKAVDRFFLEARAAAKLGHPNIVGVLNMGEQDGLWFTVMEYMPGGSLDMVMRAQGPMAYDQAVDIAMDVACALQSAHQAGIIHRDVKPANIFLGKDGHAKVGDLGLVKVRSEDADLTMAGIAMGTPRYIAPEQAKDASLADARSDVYSLGCTLYQMVSGRPPYEGHSHLDIIDKHLHAPVPDPSAVCSDLPPRLAALIRRMMAKKPEDRFEDADALLAALQGCVRRKKRRRRVQTRTGRRSLRRAILVAGGVVIVAAAAGVCWLGPEGLQRHGITIPGFVPLTPEDGSSRAGTVAVPKPVPAEDRFAAAEQAERGQDYIRAVNEYVALARDFPQHPSADDALLAAGNLLMKSLHDPIQALAAYEKCVRLFPDGDCVPEALFRTAQVFDEYRPARTKAAYWRVIEEYPESGFAAQATRHLPDPLEAEKRRAELAREAAKKRREQEQEKENKKGWLRKR